MLRINTLDAHIAWFTIPYKDIFTTVAILRSENGSVLFDAAFREEDVQMYILPALKQLGVDDLKYIFISHNHGDHAGGLQWLLPALPQCRVISCSSKLPETYPDAKFVLPRDGEIFLEHFQVVTIPGHTADSAALLDRRTGTLISGDCLQVYGIYGSGAWGAVIRLIGPHLQAHKKLHDMDINTILAAHDYHPYGQLVTGKDKVKAYLDGCIEALARVRDILKENLDFANGEVAAICNDGKLPTVPEGVVTAIRNALEEGSF